MELKSASPVTLYISQQTNATSVMLASGTLELTPNSNTLQMLNKPLVIFTKAPSVLQSEGKIIAEKGENITLLPSGFSKEISSSNNGQQPTENSKSTSSAKEH